MSSTAEVQKLLYDTLKGDGAIMAIANGVYDRVPDNPFGQKTAYISFGSIDTAEDDADCITGVEITAQIDVWSKKPGKVECRTLTDLVRRKLHRASLELTENALVGTWVVLTRVFSDPDPLTSHGVVQVTCMVEEPR
ncbi:MAG: hypothetical protein CL535_16340 [Ahrensia sp.]|nr:hypothetical protein [Ahrensia sp.]MBV48244.1 hypothetical protein [Roseobacter sp.]|tara:strand:- start:121483 stop:121893 length:411 start_codon:yes stop_codon:yes gene_type:complete